MKLDMMANVTLPSYPFLCSLTKVVPLSKIIWVSDEANYWCIYENSIRTARDIII